ncbi:PREDICTED: epidermal growth factor receptor kinase substrate 8-like isoform X8 [Branchiostoma belcheri]|uniref:Epidermal growth factor receptor kinase substrate 8-like isoform X8 n=1 Tax=Branchiostoma belcheri TaxID=7741 RepID=A0A6P4XUH6_BRABE|nr:PREDICTED: epidermal growth factor receptor kinase substrate 8-like isoform X8 [Branchiostoma belcheri]
MRNYGEYDHDDGFSSYSDEASLRGRNSSIANGYAPSGQNGYQNGFNGASRPSAKEIYEQRKKYAQARDVGEEARSFPVEVGGYPIEHLATYAMDPKNAMLTIEDGVRKLKLMDAKGKIWTQEMTMTVDERAVLLIDNETHEELENFPLSAITINKAVMNEGNYNSILVLAVKDPNQKFPDMHMFQTDRIPADVICKDIKAAIDDFKSGKKRYRPPSSRDDFNPPPHARQDSPSAGSSSRIPPPPVVPAPQPPAGNVKRQAEAFESAAAQQQNGYSSPPKSPPARSPSHRPKTYPNVTLSPKPLMREEEDSPELQALKTDRDVQILNHIFDDIENFVSRLQKAADAFNELSKRKKNKKSKRKQQGEGLLTVRARPPPETDYIDCFQKFKYAFNLLAKLRPHIHDPNAPELVHFLFTPLELVIESCQGVDLAKSVVSPLLTDQAIDLLKNCVTSREGDLWLSLGPAWTTSRANWSKDQYVPPYIPRFRDGWEPPPIPGENNPLPVSDDLPAVVAHKAAAVARDEEMRKSTAREEAEERSSNYRDQPSNRTPERDVERRYNDRYESRPHDRHSDRHYDRYMYDYRHRDRTPERYLYHHHRYNHFYDRPYRKNRFRPQRAYSERRVWSAETLLRPGRPQRTPSSQSHLSAPPGHAMTSQHIARLLRGYPDDVKFRVLVRHDFVARNDRELTVVAQEILDVLDDTRTWWNVRNISGQSGFVPSTILDTQLPSPAQERAPNGSSRHSMPPEPVYHHHIQKRSSDTPIYASHIPPSQAAAPPPPAPVPPPPPPSQPTAQPFRNSKKKESPRSPPPEETRARKPSPEERQADDLQEELKTRMTMGKHRKFAPRPRAPSISIDYDSTPEEVTKWLQSRGFSKLTVESLGVLTGAQLFSLTKDELKTVCYEEGQKVYSQITVQKSLLDQQGGNQSELQDFLKHRRETVDMSSDPAYQQMLSDPPPDFEPSLPTKTYN